MAMDMRKVFEEIRKKNILGQTPQPEETPTFQSQTIAPSPEDDDPYGEKTVLPNIVDIMKQFGTPDYTDRNRYRQQLDQMPQRQSPGLGRTLVAGALSLKAQDPIETTEKVQYAPYHRTMADWTAGVEPRAKAAQFENTANANDRALAGNVATAAVGIDRNIRTQKVADEKNRISDIRARAYQMKSEGWDFDFTTPYIIATKASTGEKRNLGPTGKMDQQDQINLRGQWDVKSSEARSGAMIEAANIRATRTLQDDAGNIFYETPSGIRPETPGTAVKGSLRVIGTASQNTSGGGTGTKTNRLEKAAAEQSKMEQLYKVDPLAQSYIKPKNGKYEMSPRPVLGSSKGIMKGQYTQDDIDMYDELRKEVYPNETPAPTRSQLTAPKQAPPSQQGRTPQPTVPGPSIVDQRRQMGRNSGKTPAKSPSLPYDGPGLTQSQRRMQATPMPANPAEAAAQAPTQSSNPMDEAVYKAMQSEMPPGTLLRRDKDTGNYQVSVDGKNWMYYTPGLGGGNNASGR